MIVLVGWTGMRGILTLAAAAAVQPSNQSPADVDDTFERQQIGYAGSQGSVVPGSIRPSSRPVRAAG
jgi:hypothetical protein